MNAENIEIVGDFTFLPRWTPIPQYFPGKDFDSFPFPPPSRRPPAGRWVWVPYPTYGGCGACRGSGVCMCVRPDRQIFC